MRAQQAARLQPFDSAQGTRTDIKRALDETLLERLVALNSERAEEEKRGIVRWLRPEYQNKQHATRSLSGVEGSEVEMPIISAQTEMDVDVETETPAITITEKLAWPKGDIEQVKAVIDVLAASKSPLDLDAIAANFTGKGAWKKRLPSILEMLVVVGKARVDGDRYAVV
jgi:hypothetical protein